MFSEPLYHSGVQHMARGPESRPPGISVWPVERCWFCKNLMGSCCWNMTVRFTGDQQSSNMKTTFDNDFCCSSHGKTDRILCKALDGQNVIRNIAQNFDRFSQHLYVCFLLSHCGRCMFWAVCSTFQGTPGFLKDLEFKSCKVQGLESPWKVLKYDLLLLETFHRTMEG